ncbi:MAG: hypothetical protein GX425_07725 [Peptococcaceae bacterium]|nr:hypothetical protein [Peptococcaceae bacterium]
MKQPQTFLRSACAGVEAGGATKQGHAPKINFIGYSGADFVFSIQRNSTLTPYLAVR